MAYIEELAQILSSSPPFFNISTHFLADADALCSAFLLHSLFPKRSRVILFDKPSRTAAAIAEKYNLNYEISQELDPSTTVLVDTDDPSLIPRHKEKFFAVIDHHSGKVSIKTRNYANLPTSPSTTHIIYNMMKLSGKPPTPLQADLILIGILADTYRFKSVQDPSIFKDVSTLLSLSASTYDSLISLLEHPLDESERLVFARSFSSYSLFRDSRKKLIFIMSDCASFQSLVATRLVECLNADFGLAYAPYKSEGEVRISIRSSSRLGIHLGMFAAELGSRLGGSGGGHMHSAGANIPLQHKSEIESVARDLLRNHYSLKAK